VRKEKAAMGNRMGRPIPYIMVTKTMFRIEEYL
jgi:hypothetical protein